ncbi:unnamed protein product [Lampetra planeri]
MQKRPLNSTSRVIIALGTGGEIDYSSSRIKEARSSRDETRPRPRFPERDRGHRGHAATRPPLLNACTARATALNEKWKEYFAAGRALKAGSRTGLGASGDCGKAEGTKPSRRPIKGPATRRHAPWLPHARTDRGAVRQPSADPRRQRRLQENSRRPRSHAAPERRRGLPPFRTERRCDHRDVGLDERVGALVSASRVPHARTVSERRLASPVARVQFVVTAK